MDVPEIAAVGQTPEHYETILENIHDAVYTLDKDGYINWVNQIAFDEFDIGYSREDLIGAHVSKVLSDEDIEKCVEIISDLLESDGQISGHCEIELQTAYGGEIPCDLRLTLFPADGQEFHGTVGVLRDITDRKRREEGLMVLNRVLRHNLRNNLNVILGRAQILQKDIDDKEGHLKSIRESAYELERLGDKARRGGEVLTADNWSVENLDAVDIVKNTSDNIREQYPKCEIELELPSEAYIQAEPAISFAIMNILENAVKHSDQDAPIVHVSIDANTDDWVELRITDDGPGIPSKEIKPLNSGKETPLNHGSGLGLWICKWVVERCGGEFSVENGQHQGTTVVVRLRPGDI